MIDDKDWENSGAPDPVFSAIFESEKRKFGHPELEGNGEGEDRDVERRERSVPTS
jgi:hypothetical protein